MHGTESRRICQAVGSLVNPCCAYGKEYHSHKTHQQSKQRDILIQIIAIRKYLLSRKKL